MPLSRAALERQLNQAQQNRDACADRLQKSGVDEKSLKKQPAWRNANAACRQLKRRLEAVTGKEKLAADVAAHKAGSDGEE